MRTHCTSFLILAAAITCSAAPQIPASAKHPTPVAAKVTSAPKAEAPLLPSSFSGWEATAPITQLKDPAQIDPASAAALKEYDFTDGIVANYSRGSDTLKLKALRFTDASGAYGAYTYFRHSGWPKEQIGTGAASDHNRVLFWQGNVFVDAEFSHVSAMTGSELRDLASTIPMPVGNKNLPPPVLGNMPQKEIDGQTTHYALGPAGYAGSTGSDGVLPASLVGFERGAETVTANYGLRSGEATLTVINYPTPQMAAAQAKTIAAYLKTGGTPQQPFTKALQDSNPTSLEVRRSGPIVAVVSGDAIQDEAHKLVAGVHYEADMAVNVPGGGDTEVQKTAKLLVGIITLVVVMFVAALLLALFLGGGRAAFRFARGKPISSVYDQEFTSLDLKD